MGSRPVGKVALISGAARGMGSTEAGLLVEEGARVVLGDLLDEEGQFIADGLNKEATSKRATRYLPTSRRDQCSRLGERGGDRGEGVRKPERVGEQRPVYSACWD
jgi:NAD(P)-dependent dehydrogenase (short-subunit alcohol dehydrogenase family)